PGDPKSGSAERGIECAKRHQPGAEQERKDALPPWLQKKRLEEGGKQKPAVKTAPLRGCDGAARLLPARSARGIVAQRANGHVGALQRHGQPVAREGRDRRAGVADPDAIGGPDTAVAQRGGRYAERGAVKLRAAKAPRQGLQAGGLEVGRQHFDAPL